MPNVNANSQTQSLQDDFEDFFENTLCGFLTLDDHGVIIRCNRSVAIWTGAEKADLQGKKFTDLFTTGDKIFYETHLRPLLRIQGYFDQASLQLRTADGKNLHVFVNAQCRKDYDEQNFIRVTIFNATDRGLYEQALRDDKAQLDKSLLTERDQSALREQFIAVLGHDLRNPLGAISGGLEVFSYLLTSEREKKLLGTMKKSADRMLELINNVMDLARSRLGDGIHVNISPTPMASILTHVVAELSSTLPERRIVNNFSLSHNVNCDAARISQILSNLLANAITHGAKDSPIFVDALTTETDFQFSVTNLGSTIAADALQKIFEPFTREGENSSMQGLGLGLYIASQIAEAHDGTLSATSVDGETRFQFKMKRA
jgi:phosphoserine phosphatase RsbU/P